MKKFLVLYRTTTSAQERMAKVTPEQGKAMMAAWASWGQKTGSSLVEMGAPTGETALIKGSASPGFIGGYSIVQSDSLNGAKKLFDAHPHFESPGASIELLELAAM